MKRFLRLLVVLLALCIATPLLGVAAGQTGKTVHVKGYTKKDGTKVAAHDRKAPEPKATKAAKTPKPPAATTASAAVARDAKGNIQRSDAARHAFARQTGFPNGRPGYVIDHVVPLACGGADAPSNMQWQSVAAAKAKDKVERIGCK